ncbi:kinase-like domain-containing protein [Trichoderma chlorosporum]
MNKNFLFNCVALLLLPTGISFASIHRIFCLSSVFKLLRRIFSFQQPTMSVEGTNQQIEEAVRKELEDTKYAISSLTPLSGGTANFIYRAKLQRSLPGGVSEVVLKHGEAYVAQHPDFKLKMVRCNIEEEGLRLLSQFPCVISSAFEVGTPKLYHFNPASNTQIQEYVSNAVNLKDYALRHFQYPTSESARPQCFQLGQGLGRWLRGFHNWSDQPERQNLSNLFAKNTDMRNIKKFINYDRLIARMTAFPDLLQEYESVLQEIVSMATAELADESQLKVIHGDFWTGNVLLPNVAFADDQVIPVRVIDWEMAQVGVRAEDLGQLIAELWELKLYKDIDAGLWIIQGFVEGYGKANTEFVFRVLIHVGAHLVCIGSTTPGWGTSEQRHDIAKVGRDVLLNAWKKDANVFEKHDLQCLFN